MACEAIGSISSLGRKDLFLAALPRHGETCGWMRLSHAAMPSNSDERLGHSATRGFASLARIGAPLHAVQLLAAVGAGPANSFAGTADHVVLWRSARHESSGGCADRSTIRHGTDMLGARMSTTNHQAVAVKHFGADLGASDAGIAAFSGGRGSMVGHGVRLHGGVLRHAHITYRAIAIARIGCCGCARWHANYGKSSCSSIECA
jgi:hypothetical protein